MLLAGDQNAHGGKPEPLELLELQAVPTFTSDTSRITQRETRPLLVLSEKITMILGSCGED